MPKSKLKNNNDIINFYELEDVKKLNNKYENPNYDLVGISHPSRVLIVSGSGGGKTNCLMNFIYRTGQGKGTFGHITLVSKMDEPLYTFLKDKLGENFTHLKNLADLPEPDKIENQDKQQLLIFDDMVAEKNQSKISEYILRGRKIGRGITIIYISQKYHKTPIFIRANINYLILLKISGQNDLSRILSDYTLAVDLKDFKDIYKDATKSKLDFMKIDIDEGDPNKKISKNWIDYYQIEE